MQKQQNTKIVYYPIASPKSHLLLCSPIGDIISLRCKPSLFPQFYSQLLSHILFQQLYCQHLFQLWRYHPQRSSHRHTDNYRLLLWRLLKNSISNINAMLTSRILLNRKDSSCNAISSFPSFTSQHFQSMTQRWH